MPGISFRVPKKETQEEPPSPPRQQAKKPKPGTGARVMIEPDTVKA
jgi:hypothetical protein